MTELYTINEDIFEQVKQTIQLGLETNTKLIRFKIDYLKLIIELLHEINETEPFNNYDYYCWIVRKNIKWLDDELDAHEPGIKRMLLRMEQNKDNEEYLMNCHLRVSEHIKQWDESYHNYVNKLELINNGTINVLDTFKDM